MADRDEDTAHPRPAGRTERSDQQGRTPPRADPGSRDDVAVIPDADDLEERYRLLRELRGLGRCVGLEG